jgi:hypothetical protein
LDDDEELILELEELLLDMLEELLIENEDEDEELLLELLDELLLELDDDEEELLLELEELLLELLIDELDTLEAVSNGICSKIACISYLSLSPTNQFGLTVMKRPVYSVPLWSTTFKSV